MTKRILALAAISATIVGLTSLRPLTASAVGQPGENNIPVPITLLSQTQFMDSVNVWHIVGEVQNAGSSKAEFVNIVITEYDSGGSVIGTDSTFSDVSILSPGQRSGFTVLVDQSSKPSFDHAVVSTIDDQVATDAQNQWFTTTVNPPTVDGVGMQHLAGTVRNLNSTTSQFVQVMFTFLDGSGQAVDTDSTYVSTDSTATVQPGATVPFELVRNPSPAWSSYEVVTQSDTAPAVGQRLATEVYQDLLSRPGDPGGLAFWAGLIDSGQPRYQIALSLAASTEYRGDQVQAQYEKYLHRSTDGTFSSGGEGFWINYIADGGTFEQLGESLIASNEYFVTRGGNTNAGYVNALYNDILGRGPESTYWVDRLNTGTPRWVVSAAILTSTEAAQNRINGFFQQFLRRLPDPGGLSFWVGQAQAGVRDEDLVASLMASDEYLGYAMTHTG